MFSFPAPPKKHTRQGFVKAGSPYNQLGRFFIGLDPAWSGISAIEFAEGAPVSFVSHCVIGENTGLERVTQPSHRNVLNLKEAFVINNNMFFLYAQWGLTLKEIQKLSPVFQLGEVEVATVCKGILRGLKYIHNTLGISHGNVACSSILITDEGEVKITGIGESMTRERRPQGKAEDIRSVCKMVHTLLRLSDATGVRGTMGILAEDFVGVPSTATAEDLLQHPFLQVSAAPWCLRPINILCAIARERK
ncbi:hypothetical protein PHISP_06310 [Aspergillus sp. HF37]|nr:hypothetical protein PHISP_06310 [Aspergillus sp. HF37]